MVLLAGVFPRMLLLDFQSIHLQLQTFPPSVPIYTKHQIIEHASTAVQQSKEFQFLRAFLASEFISFLISPRFTMLIIRSTGSLHD